MYVTGAEGIFLVVDEKGAFKENNFNSAISVLNKEYDLNYVLDEKKKKENKKQSSGSEVKNIVNLIVAKHFEPCIVFSFSKRDCEAHALALSKNDFNDEEEKTKIKEIYQNAMESLAEEDRSIPQVNMMLPLL
jgi:ATP-dependent RNA helicase DOB1